jgi:hypothetical protein
MEQLGQGLSSFALQLVSDAEARRNAVARIRSETKQMRGKFARELRQTTQEIHSLSREVSRSLTDNRRRRLQVASEESAARRQMMSRLQRQVARNLQTHRSDRLRGDRRRVRDVSLSLQQIRRRVAEIKGGSQRFTASVASQIANGRQALVKARREIAARRQSTTMRAAAEFSPFAIPEYGHSLLTSQSSVL